MPKRKQKAAKANTGVTFNHAMVYVRKLGPALRFYRGLLGFKLIEKFQGGGYARLRSPRSRTTLALHEPDPGQGRPKTGGIRLYFEARDLERLCQRLAAAGVRFTQKPKRMPWGWTHAYLKDPDGHELSLYWAGAKRFRKTPS